MTTDDLKPGQRSAYSIWMWFTQRGKSGGTTFECERALSLPHQTASPRIHELAKAGCLTLTGDRRRTERSNASVYAAVPGVPFGAFLSAPKRRQIKGLSPADTAILAAGRAYLRTRAKARTKGALDRAGVALFLALIKVSSTDG